MRKLSFMTNLIRTRVSSFFILLLSILSMPTRAYFIESPCSMSSSNASSCGQLCVIGFLAANCSNSAGNLTMKLGDTSGLYAPLIEQNNDEVQMKSLMYFSPITANTTFCGTILFTFSTDQGPLSVITSLTPGQTSHDCIDFYNATIVGYTGVTLLAPDGDGNFIPSTTIPSPTITTSSKIDIYTCLC